MNVHEEIRRLNELPLGTLKAEYASVTGEPARSNNRVFLTKRIAWRLQADREGGLSDAARTRADELARDRDLRVRPLPAIHAAYREVVGEGPPEKPGLPPVGSTLCRTYKGRRHEVRVLEEGFAYEGRVYTSLSALAKHITGSDWGGPLFFGLRNRGSAA